MNDIPLPLTRCVRLIAAGSIVATALMVVLGPYTWAARLTVAGAVLLVGVSSWHTYTRRRPVRLKIADDRSLSVELADGSIRTVRSVRPGVVAPVLISARLVLDEGETDLLVPGRSLDAHAHWQLRRALLAFRPAAPGVAQVSSTGRRGT